MDLVSPREEECRRTEELFCDRSAELAAVHDRSRLSGTIIAPSPSAMRLTARRLIVAGTPEVSTIARASITLMLFAMISDQLDLVGV